MFCKTYLIVVAFISLGKSENNILDTFHRWWSKNEILDQTCVEESTFESPDIVGIPLFEYMYDANSSSGESYKSHNLSVREGRFEGIGRLTFKEGYTKVSCDAGRVCIKPGYVSGIKVLSIIGEFTLEKGLFGITRFKLEEEMEGMGMTQNGSLIGLFRLWDISTRRLIEVCHVLSERCWKYFPDKFIYSRNNEEIDGKALLLDFNRKEVLAGFMWEKLYIIEEFCMAVINHFSIDNCMLKVDFDVSQPTGIRYSLLENDIHAINTRKRMEEAEEWESSNFKEIVTKYFQNLQNKLLWSADPDPRRVFKTAPQILRDIRPLDDWHFTAYILDESEPTTFKLRFKASFPYHGRINCYLEKEVIIFKDLLIDGQLREIDGHFHEGTLDHFVVFKLKDAREVYAKVKEGVLHGTFIVFGTKQLLPMAEKSSLSNVTYFLEKNTIGMVGNLLNGNLSGSPVWARLIGGGMYYRKVVKGVIKTVAYIYPDMETALVGEFDGFIMKTALPARISRIRKKDRIMEVFFEGSKEIKKAPVFFARPTNISFGDGPRQSDVFEESQVEIRESKIPEAGDGVFAKKPLKSGSPICFYTGLKLRNEVELKEYYHNCVVSCKLLKIDVSACSKYSITNSAGEVIEIPPMDDRPGGWTPSIGHKINCQFDGWGLNALFADYEHPRYGLILAAYALHDINPGEEIYVDYGYTKHFEDHGWYFKKLQQYKKWLAAKKKGFRDEL